MALLYNFVPSDFCTYEFNGRYVEGGCKKRLICFWEHTVLNGLCQIFLYPTAFDFIRPVIVHVITFDTSDGTLDTKIIWAKQFQVSIKLVAIFRPAIVSMRKTNIQLYTKIIPPIFLQTTVCAEHTSYRSVWRGKYCRQCSPWGPLKSEIRGTPLLILPLNPLIFQKDPPDQKLKLVAFLTHTHPGESPACKI